MSDARVTEGIPLPQGFGEDPLTQYTRLFVRFLQLVFASFEKGSYQWSPGLLNTDIVIMAESTVAFEVVEKRPAIIVARGPVAMTNIAIDQFAGPVLRDGRLVRNEDADGGRRHTDLLSSTMTYNCLSREGLEAQKIAWTAAYATRALKRSLMQAGIHRVGEDLQVGAETAPGSIVQPDTREIIMVSVSVPFYFQQTWTVAPIDKMLLTKVKLALRSEVGAITPEPSLRGPGMNGQTLQDFTTTSLNQVVTVMKTGTPRK